MTTDDLRNDIEVTRAELADTANALAAKVAEKTAVAKRVAIGLAGAAVAVAIVSRLRRR